MRINVTENKAKFKSCINVSISDNPNKINCWPTLYSPCFWIVQQQARYND